MFVLSKLKYLPGTISAMNSSLYSLMSHSSPCAPFKAAKCLSASFLHTTNPKHDLMEFFDVKENWGKDEVKVGRAWKVDELRIKSNSDLHKLWFVLLKERNMLLTMEHEANERVKLFPSPERLDKVEESMENLETVVRERNRAYFELETGETGEHEATFDIDTLGLRPFPELAGTRMSKKIDEHWHYRLMMLFKGNASNNFRKLYKEKLGIEARKAKNRKRNYVMHLLKRFPHLDIEMLKKLYPEVDVEKALMDKKARGNHPYNRS